MLVDFFIFKYFLIIKIYIKTVTLNFKYINQSNKVINHIYELTTLHLNKFQTFTYFLIKLTYQQDQLILEYPAYLLEHSPLQPHLYGTTHS